MKVLLRQVRTTLRKRIAVALEGKPRLTSEEIVKLYRRLYPERTDDIMVNKLLKKMKEGEERDVKVDQRTEDALSGIESFFGD